VLSGAYAEVGAQQRLEDQRNLPTPADSLQACGLQHIKKEEVIQHDAGAVINNNHQAIKQETWKS
jgi:hypothetical protein